ncbi:MAG: hypothetical protein H7Y13_12200 [Sphingobacteriaceae bacterium]|nr:hypothetical protein [Sphingobacteriaceae bacterium]
MKNTLNLLIALLLFASCSSNDLDRETALKLIKEEKLYPKVIDQEIYTGDPVHARKVLETGLEKSGYVTVQRTRKIMEIGKPIISFTDKAKPYLLPQTQEDIESGVWRVKIADEVLEEVTGIQLLEGGKNAVVEYKTAYKNITPFSKLARFSLADNNIQKTHFSLYEDGWRMENKSVR